MQPREFRLEHLSKSSIELYMDCGRAWAAHYRDGLRGPTSPALLIGSVFDKTLELYFRAKAIGQAPADLLALYSQCWLEETTGDRASLISWSGELPQQVENVGARLVGSKLTAELLSRLDVLITETGPALQQRIELRVPGVPIPAIGFLDIVTADGVPGDFKTAGRAWGEGKARHELQPRLYLAALLQAGYVPPKGPGGGYLFRHWIWTKTKEPRIQEIETEFSASEVFVAMDLVAEAWNGISKGVFMPNSGSWRCSGEYCQVWAQCMGRR